MAVVHGQAQMPAEGNFSVWVAAVRRENGVDGIDVREVHGWMTVRVVQ